MVDIAEADAVSFDSSSLFATPLFSRVYFSYTLSMIPPWESAITHGWKHVAQAASS